MTDTELLQARTDIAEFLRKKRQEKGISQYELAERSGVNRVTIVRTEKAQNWLNMKQFIAICKVLDTTPDAIEIPGDGVMKLLERVLTGRVS